MDTLLAIIDRYDWIIYIVCAVGALIYLSWAIAAHRERRQSIFSLEREEKGAEVRRAVLLFLIFAAILATTAYVNVWVFAEGSDRPALGPTLAVRPTLTPSPVIGQALPTSTATSEPTVTASVTLEPVVPLETPAGSPTEGPSPTASTSPEPTASATEMPPTASATPAVPATEAPPTEPPLPTATPPPPTEAPPTAAPPPPTAAPPPPTAAPPPVPAAFCPSPGVQISSPGNGQHVSGAVDIYGTANIDNFQFYKVEYSGGGGFSVIGDLVYTPVSGGYLTTWNAGGFGSGTYTLRLTVVDVSGNYPAPCEISVIIP